MIELGGDPETTTVKVRTMGRPAHAPCRLPAREVGWLTRREAVLASAAAAAAVAALWITLRADFLAYPGWLAAQKADLVLGPVLSGLYWLRRRPRSRFGPLLIAVGFLSVPYILQSSAAPWAFTLGVLWEGPIVVITLALILGFPSGRLDGAAERAILAAACVGVVVPLVGVLAVAPQITAAASISGCRDVCPANALLIWPNAALAGRLEDSVRIAIAAVDLAAMALIAQRFARGTPPRRRALAIGTPIALMFLGTQLAHQVAQLLALETGPVDAVIRWTYVAARAAVWYGFLIALVVAELFAGRVLRRVVDASLQRPSLGDIQAVLRGPLGDPRLRLAYWERDGAGAPLEPGDGQVLAVVERDGRPAVAIVHDAQLADDPELVHAAGAVALLAREHAELELAWTESLRQLRDSRARIAAAGDAERRALERDLHDGVQQRLTAVLMRLGLVSELLPQGSAAQLQLADLGSDLEETLHELRRLAHGISPAPLAELGIVGALRVVATRSGGTIDIAGDGLGRYPPEVESAVYYCCLEALQNATKHAGPAAAVAIRLSEAGADLCFEVRDDGVGFDPAAAHGGVGLRNMRDRLDALHGRLEITAAPGRGAVIAGAVPITG